MTVDQRSGAVVLRGEIPCEASQWAHVATSPAGGVGDCKGVLPCHPLSQGPTPGPSLPSGCGYHTPPPEPSDSSKANVLILSFSWVGCVLTGAQLHRLSLRDDPA